MRAALSFLTVLPVMRRAPGSSEMAAMAAYFPAVGLLLGLALAGLDWGLGKIFPVELTSALLIAALLALTGALHFEGFLDCCDGVFSGATRERRLEIMRDPHVGAFAVAGGLALVLVKWAALAALAHPTRPWGLILFPVLSRWGMALALVSFPYARAQGLGTVVHQGTTLTTASVSTLAALAMAVLIGGLGGLILVGVVVIVVLVLGRWLTSILGGLTGDTYGTINEVSEVILLLAAVVLMRWEDLLSPLPKTLGGL